MLRLPPHCRSIILSDASGAIVATVAGIRSTVTAEDNVTVATQLAFIATEPTQITRDVFECKPSHLCYIDQSSGVLTTSWY